MSEVLIIDRNSSFCKKIAEDILGMGWQADSCRTLAKCISMLHRGEYSAILLSDSFTDNIRSELLPEIKRIPSLPEVLILSDEGDPDAAESFVRNGAWGYLTKPVSQQRLQVMIQRIMDNRQEKLSMPDPAKLKRTRIIGSSPQLLSCLETVAFAAATDANVLITGETGTGKELFARAIHDNSIRSGKSFVVVDCAALPNTLAESVLFGHEKGAFTSADIRSEGLVKQADQGTLFLDEVGELPLSIQKVFLRVLEQHSYRPVGGAREQTSRFRLVAATNRNLEVMVDESHFRKDIYFRLRGVTMELPPLRKISDDIYDLANNFIIQHSKRMKIPKKKFSQDFLEALMMYEWPGNVRELFHTIERALSVSGNEEMLYPRHLPTPIRAKLARISLKSSPVKTIAPQMDFNQDNFPRLHEFRNENISRLERKYLIELLEISKGDIVQAQKKSGLSRSRLYALLKEHHLSKS